MVKPPRSRWRMRFFFLPVFPPVLLVCNVFATRSHRLTGQLLQALVASKILVQQRSSMAFLLYFFSFFYLIFYLSCSSRICPCRLLCFVDQVRERLEDNGGYKDVDPAVSKEVTALHATASESQVNVVRIDAEGKLWC